MKNKILSLVMVLILISSVFILTGCVTDKIPLENEAGKIELNKKTAEEVINEFSEYMKNNNITSARELISLEDFNKLLERDYTETELEELLNEIYDEVSIIYTASIKNISEVKTKEEFEEITDTEGITQEEYDEKLGDYLVYSADLELDGETETTLYIITKDMKLVGDAAIIAYDSSRAFAANATKMDNVEKEAFNSQFEEYEGKQHGVGVKQLLMSVITSNSVNTDKIVSIEKDGKEVSTESEIKDLYLQIAVAKYYNVTLKYTEGMVSKIIIEE